MFSESCSALTGQVQRGCRDPAKQGCVPLNMVAGSVALTGVPGGGPLEGSPAGGEYRMASPPDPLWGTDPVTVTVTGGSEANAFPGYEQTIQPSPVIAVTAPSADSAGIVGRDLDVQWEAGGAAYVEITLQVDRQGDTDTVVCLTRDDGCHAVPGGAIDWLTLNIAPTDRFKLRIARYDVTTKELDQRTGAEIKVVSRVEMTLPQ